MKQQNEEDATPAPTASQEESEAGTPEASDVAAVMGPDSEAPDAAAGPEGEEGESTESSDASASPSVEDVESEEEGGQENNMDSEEQAAREEASAPGEIKVRVGLEFTSGRVGRGMGMPSHSGLAPRNYYYTHRGPPARPQVNQYGTVSHLALASRPVHGPSATAGGGQHSTPLIVQKPLERRSTAAIRAMFEQKAAESAGIPPPSSHLSQTVAYSSAPPSRPPPPLPISRSHSSPPPSSDSLSGSPPSNTSPEFMFAKNERPRQQRKSEADHAVDPEEERLKVLRQKERIQREFFDTEESYFNSLTIVVNVRTIYSHFLC